MGRTLDIALETVPPFWTPPPAKKKNLAGVPWENVAWQGMAQKKLEEPRRAAHPRSCVQHDRAPTYGRTCVRVPRESCPGRVFTHNMFHWGSLSGTDEVFPKRDLNVEDTPANQMCS